MISSEVYLGGALVTFIILFILLCTIKQETLIKWDIDWLDEPDSLSPAGIIILISLMWPGIWGLGILTLAIWVMNKVIFTIRENMKKQDELRSNKKQ